MKSMTLFLHLNVINVYFGVCGVKIWGLFMYFTTSVHLPLARRKKYRVQISI